MGHRGVSSTVSSGGITVTTTGGIVTTLTSTSDVRLKTRLRPYRRGLADVLHIHPQLYHWNEEGQRITKFEADVEHAGFVAQDVQQALPEAIGKETHDGTDYLTVNDRPIVAALVNAVKEQQAEISALKRELEDLKHKMEP